MANVSPTNGEGALVIGNLLDKCAGAVDAADRFRNVAIASVGALVRGDQGRVDSAKVETCQFAVHGLAWVATYVESLRQLYAWAERLEDESKLGELELLILQAGFGEYLSQLGNGIAMSAGEMVRPQDLNIAQDAVAALATPEVGELIYGGNTVAVRARIAELIADAADTGRFGETGLDETLEMVREQFRRFTDEKVAPHAHDWHLNNDLIPLEVIQEMSELGVFGLTVPEQYGGLGMDKTSMCVVSEELCRGYIGVGSLGTRAEIACRAHHGRRHRGAEGPVGCRRSPRGEILPTAVFTEPNTSAPIWAPCAPGRSGTATSTRSPATRPGSPTPPVPT